MKPRTLLLTLSLTAGLAATATAHDAGHRVAGPVDNYAFDLAAAGTYELPVIKPAAGGEVLDETGARHELRTLLEDRMTVLAFVYTRCGDVCPLATMRLAELRDMATRVHGLSERLQFITMSFDPDHDTPARMAEYARTWREETGSAAPWLFLTSPGADAVAPILAAYNQPVAPKADREDVFGPLSHLLRVFLIDGRGRIRNIYSPDFLDPRLILNDLSTLTLRAEG